MGSILDAMGALVIGSMFLVTMFNALLHITNTGHNLNLFHSLKGLSDDVFTICDSLYLKNVGAGVTDGDPVILNATPTRIRFRARVYSETAPIDTVDIVMADSGKYGYPLYIYRNGLVDAGPFWMSDSLDLTYYNMQNTETTIIDSIYSVRVDFILSFDHYAMDEGNKQLHYPLTFWRYFFNRYQ